jgi:UDP-N-acetyl-2-amino-2-deoxyglucuronate dehydrogenase
VNYAIIGCGRVAPNHQDAVAHAGARLLWACDLDLESARAIALLADPRVDAVSICVGHGDHAPLVRAALIAGKHLLVEKPFVLSVTEGESLVQLAEQRGLTLTVVAQHRFDPLVKAVKEALDRGLLGTPLIVSAHLECARPAEYFGASPWRGTWKGEGGSAAINQGYHYIDVLCFLGGPVLEAQALGGTLVHKGVIETEDTILASLRHDNGTLASFAVTVGSSVTWRSRIAIVGTLGSVTFDMDFPNSVHAIDGSDELRALLMAAGEEHRRSAPPPGLNYYGISHRDQISDFLSAIAAKRKPRFDGTDALVTLRALAKVYTAAGYSWGV